MIAVYVSRVTLWFSFSPLSSRWRDFLWICGLGYSERQSLIGPSLCPCQNCFYYPLSVNPKQDGLYYAAYMIAVHLSSFPQHQYTSVASSLMEHLPRDYFPEECSHQSSLKKDTQQGALYVSQGLSRKQMAASNWIIYGEFNKRIIRENGASF